MKKKTSLFRHILVFVLAQVAWLSLVGLWIYWYVSNHIVFSQVSEWISPRTLSRTSNIAVFVGGLVLLVAISFAMSLIFRNLNVQLNLNRFYDNFIANVTHELKSPLASMQLYLETMSERDISKTKQKEFLRLMRKDAIRLNNLINSILEIAKLEQKKVAHDFHIYNADKLIGDIVEEARQQSKLPADAISLRGTGKCRVVVDKQAMLIVFNNLMDNAIKYSVGYPAIDVILSSSDKNFTVCFVDHGIGISLKKQKKIFNKFYRLHDARSPSVKGTGLGLYWVREIIKYHGGNISVHSEGKDLGTKFTIELPVYPATKRRYIKRLLKLTHKLRQSSGQEREEQYDTAT
ncbi:sensor histidine kinase [candidate division KSB1 bacterium]|nr:sensor histidine kinase [candidate division KSB1 bacterium]